jgi:hypothetical protein
MTKMAYRVRMGVLVATASCLIAVSLPASAQRNGNYRVQEMNFDLWCQEQAGLPAERCDKRTAQDEATFEAYRAKVEAYEIPYLQQKQNAARLDTDILRNDPVDRPISKNPTPDRPDLNAPSTTVPPRP